MANETRSNTPLLIIGAVLIAALLGGWYLFSSSKSTTTTSSNSQNTANSANNAVKGPTIPADAPRGAEPPNMSGSPTAMVKLEEFADFQCGSCAAAHPVMNELKSIYGTRIQFVFRNFPLEIPAHDKSYDAAVAAEAAGMQGPNKFWEMQNLLFSNQTTWTKAPTYKDIWRDYAQKIGLDVKKWENDQLGMVAKQRVNADVQRGKAINISATPTLFVNGVSVAAAQMKLANLRQIIDAELQKVGAQNTGSGAAPPAADGNSAK